MLEQIETKNPIQVADKIFLVIEVLAQEGSLGLQDLSNRVGLNKSTTHRILNSLIYLDYAKQDEATSKYRLSFKIWEIANHFINKIDIVDILRPIIRELVNKIEETVHLVQLEGEHAIYLDKIESYSNTIRMASNVGKTIPLYCSGVGKALLANMKDSEIETIWNNSKIICHTEYTITNFNTFMKEIQMVRKLGYALDNEENETGVRCIAAALQTKGQDSIYAFSVSAPIGRMDDPRIQELSLDILNAKNKMQLCL